MTKPALTDAERALRVLLAECPRKPKPADRLHSGPGAYVHVTAFGQPLRCVAPEIAFTHRMPPTAAQARLWDALRGEQAT